jgi:hypothetical protein
VNFLLFSLQDSVAQEANTAIEGVNGNSYTVGTAANVLCEFSELLNKTIIRVPSFRMVH